MLHLDRKVGETIVIGVSGEITVKVVRVDRGRVRLAITAPQEIPVYRSELLDRERPGGAILWREIQNAATTQLARAPDPPPPAPPGAGP